MPCTIPILKLKSPTWAGPGTPSSCLGASRASRAWSASRHAPVGFEDLGFLIEPEAAAQVFPMLRAEQFDLAFQMQGGGYNSNPFIQRLGARLSIGMRERGAVARPLAALPIPPA
jgi:hypothetical protein